MKTKQCSQCGEVKPLTDFASSKISRDGKEWECKACKNMRSRLHYAANKSRLQQQHAEYYAKNARTILDHQREYRKSPAVVERHKKYRLAHRDQFRLKSKRWKEENGDRVLLYRVKNRDRLREQRRLWHTKNMGKVRAIVHKRRARELGNGGSFTSAEWEALCTKHGNRCLACGKEGALTVDHVLPVSKGGTGDIGNIQPLCLPCNLKKYDRHIDYRPAGAL